MRQQDVRSKSTQMNALRRLSFAVSFTVSLILSMSPLLIAPVAAAPPEANQEATTESAGLSSDPGTAGVDPLTVETPQVPQTENESAADAALRDSGNDGDGSVRLRGLEAPVQLEQPDARGADQPPLESKPPAKQQDVERDPGDGPVRKRQEPAKSPDRLTQPAPRLAGGFQQTYFVFREDEEVAVLICLDTTFSCDFDQLIERPKSLPVTTQKSGPFFGVGEFGAAETGRKSSEGVLHASSLMWRGRSNSRA